MASYENVMDALLAYLKAQIPSNTFLTYRRGIVLWPELSKTVGGTPVIRQPALFLFDGVFLSGGGVIRYQHPYRAVGPVRTLTRTICLYARTPVAGSLPGGFTGGLAVQNTTTSQASILHPLLEAVETAISTPDDPARNTLTLGGLVAYCRVEGEGILVSPDIDEEGQGMATLPIEIRVP
jgi:hypothetical protein